MSDILFSVVHSENALAKTYAYFGDALTKTPGGPLVRGSIEQREINALRDLPGVIDGLSPCDALVLGVLRDGRVSAPLTTIRAIEEGRAPDGAVARSLAHIGFSSARGLALFDHDGDLPPEAVHAEILRFLPEAADAAFLAVPSSSHGIAAPDGTLLKPQQGWHLYAALERGSDLSCIKSLLHERVQPEIVRSKSGARLRRYVVDDTVFSPERLDFAGKTFLAGGLQKIAPTPFMINAGGGDIPALEVRVQVQGARLAGLPAPTSHHDAGDRLANIAPAHTPTPAAQQQAQGNLTAVFVKTREWAQKEHVLTADEEEKVERACAAIPWATGALPYHQWIVIGMALRHYGKKGEDIWMRHSCSQEPHDPREVLIKKFRSFPLDNNVRLGTLFYIAREYGYLHEQVEQQDKRNDELPPLRPGLTLEAGRQKLAEAVRDFGRDPQGIVGIWGSTGLGKSHAISDLVLSLRAGGRDGKVVVEGCRQQSDALALQAMLESLGRSVVTRFGREELDGDEIRAAGSIHAVMDLVPNGCYTPHQPRAAYTLREHGHSCASAYCHRGCAIGDNRMARTGGGLKNPHYPDYCYLDYAREQREAPVDVMIVVGNAVAADLEGAAAVVRDEEGTLIDVQTAEPSLLLNIANFCEAALQTGALAQTWGTKAGFALSNVDEIEMLRDAEAWFRGIYQAIGSGSAIPAPPRSLLDWKKGFPWESVALDGRKFAGEIPRRFTQDLLENWQTAAVENGAIYWSSKCASLRSKKPMLILSATPSDVARTLVDREVRIELAQNAVYRQDVSAAMGLGDEEKQGSAVFLAEKVCKANPEMGFVQLFGKKKAAELFYQHKHGQRDDPAIMRRLGVSYRAAGGIGHNDWIGRNVASFGTERPPVPVLVERYRNHRVIMRSLNVELAPWNGEVTRVGTNFLPAIADAREWLLNLEADAKAQEFGRMRGADWQGPRPLQFWQFGGLDVVKRLRTRHNIHAEYADDLVPNEICAVTVRERVVAAANTLAATGTAITRSAIGAMTKARHDVYQWLFEESPWRFRFAHLLTNTGVAARIKQELAAAAQALGERLQPVLVSLLNAAQTSDGLEDLQGLEDDELAALPVARLLLGGAPPG